MTPPPPPPLTWDQAFSVMLSIIHRYLLSTPGSFTEDVRLSAAGCPHLSVCPCSLASLCVWSGRSWDWNHLWGAKSQRPHTPVGPVQWGGNILSNWTWTLIKSSSAPNRKRRCSGLAAGVSLSRRDLTQCPVCDGESLLTPGFKAAALVGGWSLHSLQHRCSLNIINTDRFQKDFVGGFRVSDGRMWVSCPRVQKSTGSNVPHSLFSFMCVPCVPATFLQIFIPGVKHSWSLSPVYSPVLSLTLTFFHADWEWQRGRGRSRGGVGGGQVSVTGGQERAHGQWRGAEAWKRGEQRSRAFAVMDGSSSPRNQKPNLPRHRRAARGAATQELIVQ